MNSMRRAAVGAALVAALVGAVVHVGAADLKPAPRSTFHFADGSSAPIDTYKGKVVLVDFWASWCVPCKTSFPAVDGLFKDYRDRGLQVVAVNVDERDRDAQAFLQPRPHVMPIAFDPKGELARDFNVEAMPSSFLSDRAGYVRFVHTGYTAKDLATYRTEIDGLLAER